MLRFRHRFYLTLGTFLWLCALILVLLPNWPHLYYRLSPQTSTLLAQTISTGIVDKNKLSSDKNTTPLPPVDPSLPDTNGLIIDSIGVRGEIHEGTDWEQILKNGIWRVPDFGTPEKNDLPIILAAHRWGYLNWTNAFRKLNSFYNLPKLKTGDTLTLNWNQRQYQYQIYKSDTGTQISDYSANLVLYTCQLWDSPVRIFVYAKRTN